MVYYECPPLDMAHACLSVVRHGGRGPGVSPQQCGVPRTRRQGTTRPDRRYIQAHYVYVCTICTYNEHAIPFLAPFRCGVLGERVLVRCTRLVEGQERRTQMSDSRSIVSMCVLVRWCRCAVGGDHCQVGSPSHLPSLFTIPGPFDVSALPSDCGSSCCMLVV